MRGRLAGVIREITATEELIYLILRFLLQSLSLSPARVYRVFRGTENTLAPNERMRR